VWDSNVSEAVGERFGATLGPVEVPAGEASKSLSVAEEVLRGMALLGASRTDRVLAVGGGVTGDLAGFCAATYQRGIDLVHVPTTLVAQVDSAYGGKTGVDLPEGKNYVGAFHQPVSVLTDTGLLESLPEEELAAGMAEVVKTGLLAGGTLWETVKGLQPGEIRSRPDVIFEWALHKCEVVADDEKDRGARATLNLGHTVGHAIETATGYDRYRHGEAVSLGLLAALELSEADGLRTEVEEVVERHGLPVALDPAVDTEDVLTAVGFDKKRTDEGVAFILLEEPGSPQTGAVLPDDQVRAAIEALSQ
ncbi:MAG: 3-dehydroquinate synthase family protein, partial [Solirubrobacterales bacterium]